MATGRAEGVNALRTANPCRTVWALWFRTIVSVGVIRSSPTVKLRQNLGPLVPVVKIPPRRAAP